MQLLLRQRRAHGGAGVVEARLVEHHHVDVALDEQDALTLALAREIETVEHAALAVNDRLGRVHILRAGVVFVDNATAEAQHVAAHVDDGEDEPVAELVVYAAVFALDGEARRDELRLRVALLKHGGHQAVPFAARRAEAEVGGVALRDPARAHIFHHRLALGGVQLIVIEMRRVAVERQQPRAQAAGAVVPRVLRHLHTDALGEEMDRVGVGEVFDLHDEVDRAAALFAAEAVVHLLIGPDVERGRPLAVERAAAPVFRAPRL